MSAPPRSKKRGGGGGGSGLEKICGRGHFIMQIKACCQTTSILKRITNIMCCARLLVRLPTHTHTHTHTIYWHLNSGGRYFDLRAKHRNYRTTMVVVFHHHHFYYSLYNFCAYTKHLHTMALIWHQHQSSNRESPFLLQRWR